MPPVVRDIGRCGIGFQRFALAACEMQDHRLEAYAT